MMHCYRKYALKLDVWAAWTPITNKEILPFVSQYFPDVFSIPNTNIRTVEAKRTFWEKATILHSEAHIGMKLKFHKDIHAIIMIYICCIKVL